MSPPSDAFTFIDLVYPDPVDLAPLVSWERAVLHLGEQPKRVLARCEQRYAPTVLRHSNEELRAFAERTRSGSPEQRARVVGLGSVLERALVVVVKHVHSAEAFELKYLVWQGEALLVCHPLSLVRTGLFAPAVAQLPSASLAARLSGGALYVPEKQLSRIIVDHQRASEGEMERQLKQIIEEHEASGQKIKHADFMSQMKQTTGANKSLILRSWAKVPGQLKHMHRPRNR